MAVIKISGAVAVLTLKYPCKDTAEGHGLRCHCREGRRTWAATAIKSLSVLTVLLPKGGPRSKCQAHHQPTHLLSSSRRSVRRVRGRNLPCHCWRFRRATELTSRRWVWRRLREFATRRWSCRLWGARHLANRRGRRRRATVLWSRRSACWPNRPPTSLVTERWSAAWSWTAGACPATSEPRVTSHTRHQRWEGYF